MAALRSVRSRVRRLDKVDGPLRCPECRDREVEATCFLCARTFSIRLSQRGRPEPVCHECRVQANTQPCKNCGQLFELSAADRVYFKKRALSLPKRCAPCRKQNRPMARATSPEEVPSPVAPAAPSAPSEGLLETLARWFKF